MKAKYRRNSSGIANAGSVCLIAGLALLQIMPVRAADHGFTTFDPPGATAVHAADINESGTVVGTFLGNPMSHGFVRDAKGDFTVVDVAGAISTQITGIANDGTVAGLAFTTIFGINDSQVTVGSFNNVGFARDKAGVFATIAPPNAAFAVVCAINTAGTFTGLSGDGSIVVPGFIRSAAGVYTSIPLPAGQSIAQFSVPFLSINNSGSVTGSYGDFPGTHGFIFTP